MRIEEIEGIGSTYGVKLAEAGVATTEALLERGAGEGGRAALAASTGISPTLILEWVNHADLMRIDGVGSEYSDLLEAAGVDSAPELAERNAANLAVTFQEVVTARPGIVRRVPTEAEVASWIVQAKTLPKVVTHGGGSSETSAVAAGSTAAPMADAAVDDHAEHDHAAHDHADHPGHDHADHADHAGHDHAPASAPAVTPPGPAARSLAGATEPAAEGWWARIKRMFGG